MSKFQPVNFFQPKTNSYKLLPFRFARLSDDRYFLSNMVGEYLLLDQKSLDDFVRHKLSPLHEAYVDLRAKQFLQDEHNGVAVDLLSIKTRTKYSRLSNFTSLHIFVVSLRCEHSCPYCQVSRQSEDRGAFDMTEEIADKAIGFVFKSPAKSIKIEFQGGEPLLNFPIIKYVVERATKINEAERRNLDFVIATNLALIDREILAFCKTYGIHISTSLDGPEDLHNKNRPRPGKNSYQKAIEGIELSREVLGRDQVSALMTTTEASLKRPKEIIDEYIRMGFNGIFLRSLSPYGFAIKTKSFAAYQVDKWLDFYREAMEYIIQLNKDGLSFQEYGSSTILAKMVTSKDPGYVDLMNPSGMGIAAVVYNYDGTVHPSDESRMLAEMGDNTFLMGNVLTDSYEDVFSSDALLVPLEESMTNGMPMCEQCPYESYCGTDPVYHYAMHKDFIARKPESGFCKKNMSIFQYLVEKMEGDRYVKSLFLRWANFT